MKNLIRALLALASAGFVVSVYAATAGGTPGGVTRVQGISGGVPVPVSASISGGTVAATQSGTWTVQPGNTANTTAWKVDGSAVTQPVSAASLPLPSGAATSANQAALATAANLSGTSSNSASIVTAPGSWSVVHAPATNTQATASKSSGGGSVRHVATTITATLCAGASAITAAAPLLVNLRDGATGAGTIIWTTYINIPATAGQCAGLTLNNLNIVGSAATAMTLEFSAAGGSNSYESVTVTGYDAS